MGVYYNEIDPYCAQWLQNLMDAGQIPHGVIDTRSIEDVRPDELAGFTQCHFFAGLGGWAYALQLAGWGTRPVWTGSCPCQPFSAAGKGAGFADERHLWPAWQHLIAQCRPAVVFGEQVASKDADAWIDLVHADLEGMGYAFGCVPFPAAGIGAPHIRDRNYWVADANRGQRDGIAIMRGNERNGEDAGRAQSLGGIAACGDFRGMADANGRNASAERQQRGGEQRQQSQDGGAGGVADAASPGSLPGTLAGVHRGKEGTRSRDGESQRLGADGGLADATLGGRREERAHAGRCLVGDSAQGNAAGLEHGGGDCRPGPTNGHWRAADWLACTDGKWRPVEPGTFPLAHGIPNRVGRLRAFGNAINTEAAQAFIESYCEARFLNA